MTDDDARDMLAQLAAHFGEPVMPVSRYCAAFNAWADAIEIAADPARRVCGPDCERCGGAADMHWPFAKHIGAIGMAIGKSSMLGRMLYGGEPARTEPCPVHQGHWSGLTYPPPPCGCDLTGWLPPTPPALGGVTHCG